MCTFFCQQQHSIKFKYSKNLDITRDKIIKEVSTIREITLLNSQQKHDLINRLNILAKSSPNHEIIFKRKSEFIKLAEKILGQEISITKRVRFSDDHHRSSINKRKYNQIAR